MSVVITNPPGLHDPTSFGYSHAVSAPGEIVHIAGQYGSDATGGVVSPDFAAQAKRAFENLGVALETVGLGFADVVRLGTYLVDHDPGKLEVLVGLIREHWGDRPPAQTLIGVAALAFPDMLFEVDAVAVRS
ncbi:RidA family protein [Amycolatopsis anabasis]|uniref:RidA family protein n=1 Tax=Amycolatopsis anabasis TaxID=1840409 RepID=UPI00131DB8B0|nr:RidA family protein [Amycolatopsis anabasis]